MGIMDLEVQNEKTKEMIVLYTEMIKEMRSNSKDKIRFNKLCLKVDKAWLTFSRAEQLVICDALISNGSMSPKVKDVLLCFGGKINEEPIPEPCIRIK